MLKLSESNGDLILKRNTYFLGGILIAGIMALGGLFVIFASLPFDEGYAFAEIFGLIFVCLWEVGVIYGVVYFMREYSKYIVISKEGISCHTCFKKEFIKWSNIKDWGLSYCGQTRCEGNTYYLYFSEHECPVKNECRKKLKGRMIKTFVISEDYYLVVDNVIPFCEEKTAVMPFIGKDKFHII